MYRVNFHREYFESRAAQRRRIGAFAVLALLATMGLLIVAGNVTHGMLIKERRNELEAELARSAARAPSSEDRPELATARQMLALRNERIEWSTKVAALAARLDPSIRLLEVRGEAERKGVPAYLEIQGVVRPGNAEMEPVLELMETLRSEPGVREDLPEISLGTLEGEGSGRFRLLCEQEEGK